MIWIQAKASSLKARKIEPRKLLKTALIPRSENIEFAYAVTNRLNMFNFCRRAYGQKDMQWEVARTLRKGRDSLDWERGRGFFDKFPEPRNAEGNLPPTTRDMGQLDRTTCCTVGLTRMRTSRCESKNDLEDVHMQAVDRICAVGDTLRSYFTIIEQRTQLRYLSRTRMSVSGMLQAFPISHPHRHCYPHSIRICSLTDCSIRTHFRPA